MLVKDKKQHAYLVEMRCFFFFSPNFVLFEAGFGLGWP